MRCLICMYGQNINKDTLKGILCSHPGRKNSRYLGSIKDLEDYGFAPDDCPLTISESKTRKRLLLFESVHLHENEEQELNLHFLTSHTPTIVELSDILKKLGAKLRLDGNNIDGDSYQELSKHILGSGYNHKELKNNSNITTPLISNGLVIGFISLTVIRPILPEVLLGNWKEE